MKAFGSYLGSPEQFNSVLFGGLIGSLFSFLQFVASPVIGGMSDLFGRRPLLLLSTAGVAASYAIWATANSFKIFVLARDATPTRNRKKLLKLENETGFCMHKVRRQAVPLLTGLG